MPVNFYLFSIGPLGPAASEHAQQEPRAQCQADTVVEQRQRQPTSMLFSTIGAVVFVVLAWFGLVVWEVHVERSGQPRPSAGVRLCFDTIRTICTFIGVHESEKFFQQHPAAFPVVIVVVSLVLFAVAWFAKTNPAPNPPPERRSRPPPPLEMSTEANEDSPVGDGAPPKLRSRRSKQGEECI